MRGYMVKRADALIACPTTGLVLLLAVLPGLSCERTRDPDRSPVGPASAKAATSEEPRQAPGKRYKVLHIMSYHSPWFWTDDQYNGFKESLAGLDVEYRVYQMDTKRRSSQAWKETAGREARDLIDSWKPDLVYTSDDNAQAFVVQSYVNTDIPFVFSGVNDKPATYGFDTCSNVTGVLEQEHSGATVRLLRQIVPDAKRVAVFLDDGPTWLGVKKRMLDRQAEFGDVEFVGWHVVRTFAEYKALVKSYQKTVDALAPFGTYTYKDEHGENVPYEEVLRWTAENSSLPDMCFWSGHVERGLLCAVTVSPYEQGREAGRMARRILVEGVSPGDIPMVPTVKGRPVVNLARARKLGLSVKSTILLDAQTITEFPWEE